MSFAFHKSPAPARRAGLSATAIHGRRRGILAALAAWWILAFLASAQPPVSENSVKAAYLFNFGKFVRFTHSGGSDEQPTFDICVIGQDPLGRALDDITANERLNGKPVRVVRVKSAADGRACAIAYISSAEGVRIDSDLQALNGYEVLTVSDAADFLKHGGMIQFTNISSHVRFAVNLDAARQAHINLSSELLKVATSVNGNASTEVRR